MLLLNQLTGSCILSLHFCFLVFLDALSISGSESDEIDDHDFSESTSILKVDEDDNSSRHQDDRRPKLYFKNGSDEILSVYKKVVCSKHVSRCQS